MKNNDLKPGKKKTQFLKLIRAELDEFSPANIVEAENLAVTIYFRQPKENESY